MNGTGFIVHHIDTINAMCGSGQVNGTNYQLYSLYAANNGKTSAEAPGIPHPWADGMTLQRCDGGCIHDSTFQENSDIDVFIFKGGSCTFEHNTLKQLTRLAFGAFGMGDPHANSDFTNSKVRYNTITVGLNKAPFGLAVGPHVRGDGTYWTANAGLVQFNTVSGAVVNLAVDGIQGGTVSGNTLSSPQGSQGLVCGSSTNFTAGHYSPATGSGSFVCRAYDASCTCVP